MTTTTDSLSVSLSYDSIDETYENDRVEGTYKDTTYGCVIVRALLLIMARVFNVTRTSRGIVWGLGGCQTQSPLFTKIFARLRANILREWGWFSKIFPKFGSYRPRPPSYAYDFKKIYPGYMERNLSRIDKNLSTKRPWGRGWVITLLGKYERGVTFLWSQVSRRNLRKELFSLRTNVQIGPKWHR